MPDTPRTGLLAEDHSDIKIVDGETRAAWFRHERPEYFCGECGRYHRSWSKIGQVHDPRRLTRK